MKLILDLDQVKENILRRTSDTIDFIISSLLSDNTTKIVSEDNNGNKLKNRSDKYSK